MPIRRTFVTTGIHVLGDVLDFVIVLFQGGVFKYIVAVYYYSWYVNEKRATKNEFLMKTAIGDACE